MPYMMGGFPDLETSMAVAEAYLEGGADLIELGVPFSDPLADGPVIHEAATQALAAGIGLGDVLEICAAISARVPVILMAYTNMILSGRGPADFASRAREAGAAGVIVPDLPLGTDESIRRELEAAGLSVVPLVAPTTEPERREGICSVATGFVYVVSDVGTTGERSEVPAHLTDLVADIAGRSEVPVAVGFGIGSPEQAAEVGRIADGVIIGSRLVRLVAGAEGSVAATDLTREFLADTREATAGIRVGQVR
jgi:tryptophan synthase alpha chain